MPTTSQRGFTPTSLEAYHSLQLETTEVSYQKILAALRLKDGQDYEDLSLNTKMDKVAVNRRLSEMREKNLIKRGEKTKLSTGRQGYTHWLVK